MDELLEFISMSEKQLNEKQVSLENEKIKILTFLEKNLYEQDHFKNVMFQGRVKGASSLSEKIIRKRYADKYKKNANNFIDELPDIIGIRLVCMLIEQEEKLFNFIKSIFCIHVKKEYYSISELVELKNTLLISHAKQPEKQKNDKNIYRISCIWIDDNFNEINVELQIKSLINVFWGEIEHMLFYKNYSYMIGSHFYVGMMDTIFKSLVALDAQLQLMSQQLSKKSKEQQLDEIKEMFTKFMYTMFSEKFQQNLINIEVDLREVYSLMIQIEFKNVSSLSRGQNVMSKIINHAYNDTQFRKDLFDYEIYEPDKTILREERKELGIILDNLYKSADVFWKAFIGIYKFFVNKDSNTEVIDSMVNDLMSFYNGFDEFFDIEDEGKDGKKIIKEGIELGIIDAFKAYQKLDFFLINVHQKNIFINVSDYLLDIKSRFLSLNSEEIKKHERSTILEVIKSAFTIHILLTIKTTISLEQLQSIYNEIHDKEISGELFDIEEFEKTINKKHQSFSFDDLNTIFVKESNREEE
ncbi:nucleotidyltransferase family protein [Paenibacillus dauci]|uniref:hypothetical protein n=1 Tax=Paenibacillus dauci TaxID=1567106 RepID=UPI0006198F32|nr:hypothetical protein [Paenibacillus dauci]